MTRSSGQTSPRSSLDNLLAWLGQPVITDRPPVLLRWQFLSRYVLFVLLLAGYSLLVFWLGMQAASPLPATTAPEVAMAAAQAEPGPLEENRSESTDLPSGEPAAAPLTTGEETFANQPSIQSLKIFPARGQPGHLQAVITVANSGKKLVGELRFALEGEQNGQPIRFEFPGSAEQPSVAGFTLEVSRYLRTQKTIVLPPGGFTPRSVTAQLLEKGVLRDTKTIQVAL